MNVFSRFRFPSSRTISLILIGLFAGLSVAFFIMNQRAQTEIETTASRIFDLPVTVDDVNVSYVSHTVKIRNARIQNPDVFGDSDFMVIDEIRLSSSDLSARPIPVTRIEVRGMKVYLRKEDGTQDTNLDYVLDRLHTVDDTTHSAISFEMKPASLQLKNLTLYPRAQDYPDFKPEYTITFPTPFLNGEEVETIVIDNLLKDGIDGVADMIRQTVLSAQIKAGVDDVIDGGLRFFERLRGGTVSE